MKGRVSRQSCHPIRQLQETLIYADVQSRSEREVGAPVGAQDANQSSEDWRSGFRQ
jgi:hypothetical protein